MKKAKEEFLKRIIIDQQQLEDDLGKLVWDLLVNNEDAYQTLTHKIHINQSSPTDAGELADLAKRVYRAWHNYLMRVDKSRVTQEQAEAILKLTESEYLPENMSNDDCIRFIAGDDEQFRCIGKPGEFQGYKDGNGIYNFDEDGNPNFVGNNFFHIFPNGAGKIECRLYLNIKCEHCVEFTKKLYNESFRQNVRPIYTKFWSTRNGVYRNDSQLIYTSYEQASKVVDIINKIREESPYLFEGSENGNILMGKVDGGFIGFGEDPQYASSSFNLERANAISQYIADAKKDEFKRIATILENDISVKHQIKILLKNKLLSTINKKLSDLKNDILPTWQKDPKIKAQLNEFYNNIIKGLISQQKNSAWLDGEFDSLLDSLIKSLKDGKCQTYYNIKFHTMKKDICAVRTQNSDGSYTYQINFDALDLPKMLFETYGSQEVVTEDILDKLNPYFKKHHVSSKYPYLNTETEDEIKLIHENETMNEDETT